MCIYVLMRIHCHIFLIYDLTRPYGLLNSSDIPYDMTPYGSNAVYLTLYVLLWPCTTYVDLYGPVRLNVISYSILRSSFTCYSVCLSYTYSVDV